MVTEATCTDSGEKQRDCSNCDHYETQTIAATGHNYSKEVTDPTCTTDGYTTYTCTCGDTYTGDVTSATGHAWSDTWTSEGTTFTTLCSECDASVSVLLEYRLDSYIWLNATVTCSEGLTVELVGNEYNFVQVNGVYYLVRKIEAKEIPTKFTAVFTVAGVTLSELKIDFATYAANANVDTKKSALINKLIAYGEAAEKYFVGGFGGTVAEFDDDYKAPTANAQAQVDKQTFDGVTMETKSINMWFDEALRFGVAYELTGIDSNKYDVLQVGLLVGENFSGRIVLNTQTYGMAYLVYDQTGVAIPGGANNVPNDNIEDAYEFKNEFSANGSVLFDLTAEQYLSSFYLRPFAVLQDKEGNTYCVYGQQYGYSLEAYVNRMYNRKVSENEYYAPEAFRNLVACTWNYANAAAEAFLTSN